MWLVGTALAAPVNPWGAAIPEDTWVFEPYGYVYTDHQDAIGYVAMGYTGGDLWMGAGVTHGADGYQALAVDFMPRWFPIPQLGVVPRVGWVPGTDAIVTGGEVHAFLAAGRFAFTGDVGWRPVVDLSDGTSPGLVPALLVPEVYLLPGRVSAFVEVDPTYDLAAGALATIVAPGLSVVAVPGHGHGVAVAAQIPVDGSPISLAMTFAYSP